MRFIDEVSINLIAGKGGDGSINFRREKHVPYGGPDGGDGGHGGNIIAIADEGFNTLVHFRGKKDYNADAGGKGLPAQANGKAGDDLILKVPVGTTIYETETDRLVADLIEHGQSAIIARGGRGGHGNAYFKTPTNQTPRYAQKGEAGEARSVRLELKLLADIALIGLPNAGKSTLISVISAAKPKIADYPFTTLEPNLGVVKVDEKSFVVADIPGLIENASEGKGLGIKFLKHIERTSALVHLIDCSMLLEPYEAYEDYITIRKELEKYDDDLAWKKEIVCLTKIDAMTEEEIQAFVDFFEKTLDKKVLPISAVSGRNIDQLKRIMFATKEE